MTTGHDSTNKDTGGVDSMRFSKRSVRFGRTTTRPPEAVAHGGAHGRLVPIDPGSYKEPIGVTTP